MSDAFRMSSGVDIVKLPSAVKIANGLYEPSRMSISFECLKDLRSNLNLSTARAFGPDALVVDKVYPTLEFLKNSRPSTLTVLGLRDVLDDPKRVRAHWRNAQIDEAIERFYDLILVYGPQEIYDPLPRGWRPHYCICRPVPMP